MWTDYSGEVDTDVIAFLMAYMGFVAILGTVCFVLNIFAAVRISRAGGSGLGFFFFGWLYVACSERANHWNGFSKIIAVLLGLLTGIGLTIYVLVVLKEEKALILPTQQSYSSTYNPNPHPYTQSQQQPAQDLSSKVDILKRMRDEGRLTDEEYKEMLLKILNK